MKRISFQIKHREKSFLFRYTALFPALALLVYAPFLYHGKSLIWKPDGLTQHYNALVYLGNWGRSILQTLLTEHRLSIPLWDFSIGYGSDVLTTLHYYVIGDPLNLLAIVTPVRFTELLYCGLILLRLYLAGLSFSFFCFRLPKKPEPLAVLAGSAAYAFCGYALVLAAMHPYFINPMIYLPLLLLGAERVMQKQSPQLLIAMTALSAVSNFYFFYMLVILVVIYCAIRFCCTRHDNWPAELAASVGRVLAAALIGTAAAAVILLPMAICFLSDSRSGSELTNSLLYGWDFYERIFDQFLSLEYSSVWTYLGYAPAALLCVFLLFLKRKRFADLKAGFVILTLMLLLPAAGSAMNGFSYAANRWAFGYSFLIALILVVLWPELFRMTAREKAWVLLFTLIYLALLRIFPLSGSADAFAGLALMLLTLGFLSLSPSLFTTLSAQARRKATGGVLALICFSIFATALSYDRLSEEGYMSRFTDSGDGLEELSHNSSAMMSAFYPNSTDFFRFAQDITPLRNGSLNHGVYTIEYYWSLSNGRITRYFDELALPIEERAFKYDDLNGRASLQALAGVRYYVSEDPNADLPWSFSDTEAREYEGDIYYVSKSNEALPLGYTYDSYITEEQYESLSYLQRQQALTQGLICETAPEGQQAAELSFADSSIPFEISLSDDLYELGGVYYAAEDGAQITLTFSSPGGCETYLQLLGISASSVTELEKYTTEPFSILPQYDWDSLSRYEKNQLRRDEHYSTEISRFTMNCTSDCVSTNFSWYAGLTESSFDRDDVLIHLGYSEQEQTQAVITLPYAGVYSFESIEILALPMEPLEQQLDSLREETLQDVVIDVNQVSGTLSLSDNKLLCLSIPWSEGWTALVDGEEAELFPANTMYLGLSLEAGGHTIELTYRTPGLKTGVLLSCSGLLCWAAVTVYQIRKKRRTHTG